MAYTLRNQKVIRPPAGKRYVHRQMALIVGTSFAQGDTVTTTTASGLVSIPSPGRLVAVNYGQFDTTQYTARAVATSGALTVKAETTAGVQIFTDADLSSVPTRPVPVGTTAVDEGRAASAATDAFSGGFPVRGGVYASIASGTEAEVIYVDFFFRLCTWVNVDLIAQSGADGTGAVTRTIPLQGAGVLAALALDFQNMPVTTDVVIKADTTDGPTLFTSTNSNTDLAPSLLGGIGADEAAAASAATDGTECGNAFMRGLYIDVAQADIYTGENEKIVCELWIDD